MMIFTARFSRKKAAFAVIFMGIIMATLIVLVGQLSPQTLDANKLTPLQLLQQWNTVEKLTLHVPGYIQRSITVIQEFHVIDQIECTVLNDVRQVGCRHNEQRERYLVPLNPTF